MSSWIDDGFQAVGRDVRELAELHRDLARAEVQDGLQSLVRGAFWGGVGLLACNLFLIALGVAAYSWLATHLAPVAAAALVAGAYLVLATTTLWIGWRQLCGLGSVLLPRTRALLWELVTCREKPNNS